MIRWVIFLIPHVIVWLATCPLSPLPYIAVWLFTTPSGLHLRAPFKWMETIDNDLTGDAGWKKEHLWSNDPRSYINKVRWLWRNGGNAVNYGLLGCDFQQYESQKPYWKRPDGYWIFRNFWQVTSTRYLELFIGWALYGPQLERCKFVCTIRLPSNKE